MVDWDIDYDSIWAKIDPIAKMKKNKKDYILKTLEKEEEDNEFERKE